MHPALVVPLRLLYRDYKSWCELQALPDPKPQDLKEFLNDRPWAKVHAPKGKGRLRTVVTGLGLRDSGS